MSRSPVELGKMRTAGRVVAEMHQRVRAAIRPGVTTRQLDAVAREVLERRGARSNFLGYGRPPFPGVICASPNDVIVHGIPGDRRLEEGDIISIDCGAIVEGWHGDAAFTAGVGQIDPEAARLIAVTEASLDAAIAAMVPGGRLSDIGAAVQATAEGEGFSVVREYTGHGIGLAMHEPPDVPNWGSPGRGRRLNPGQTYAVEPMVCAGRPETRLLDDGWTVVTRDGRLAAHAEHTIAVTEDGPDILTRP
ncbi:MAG TPA: type I methionyl aminopeptidase [Acidimicrobiales bacterium]|nr:type I methionyl aminopeptidase [Acidimicrobiales bacterium]